MCFPFGFLLSSECLKVTIWRYFYYFWRESWAIQNDGKPNKCCQKSKNVIVFESTLIKKGKTVRLIKKICCSIHHENKQT